MSIVKRVVVVALALALLAAAGVVATAWSQGYRLFAVTSGSMRPALSPGDLVVVVPATYYAPGDVVTFGHGTQVTTHRVHELDDGALVTQGDANSSPDAVDVAAEDVIGKVVRMVPDGGYVLVFFQQPTGAPAVMAGLLMMVLLWGLFFPPEQGAVARPSRGPRHARAPVGSVVTG